MQENAARVRRGGGAVHVRRAGEGAGWATLRTGRNNSGMNWTHKVAVMLSCLFLV